MPASIVTGAVLDDGRQILVALADRSAGRRRAAAAATGRPVGQPHRRSPAQATCGVGREWLLAGPAENVMKIGVGAGTGGLQTSTLAIGLASAALDYLEHEAIQRPDLAGPAAELRREHAELQDDAAGTGRRARPSAPTTSCAPQANSIALRATQAALAAAKGTGYVVGHPAGRWCREALFFLVWSCPQGVMAANLCELAGLD